MASGTTTTEADTEETLVSKRRSTSVVWNYFGFNKEDVARRQVWCKTCLATVAMSRGNTTNLFQHFKKHHKASYMITAWLKWRLVAHHIINTAPDSIGADSVGASGPVDLANKVDKFVTNISTDPTPSVAVQMLGRKKVAMVTKPGFTALIDTLDERYSMPSRTCFSQVAILELHKKQVTAELKTAEFVYYNRKI